MKKIIIFCLLVIVFALSIIMHKKEYSEKEIQICTNIEKAMCDLSGKPITGRVVLYKLDGSLDSQIDYKNGKYDGWFRLYYENGNVMFESHYKNGKLDGPDRSYKEDGTLIKDAYFENGEFVRSTTRWETTEIIQYGPGKDKNANIDSEK